MKEAFSSSMILEPDRECSPCFQAVLARNMDPLVSFGVFDKITRIEVSAWRNTNFINSARQREDSTEIYRGFVVQSGG